MSDKSKCPLCKKRFSDILKHFIFTHDIQTMEQLSEEISKARKKDGKKFDFRNYVEDLKKKIKTGEISSKDYRELIMKWGKEHNEGG